MKKLIIALMMIASLSGGLFAQNIGEKTGNAFWDYMHGRSLFGINFGPTLYAGIFDNLVQFVSVDKMVTQGGGDTTGTDLSLKHYAFGLGFSYDFAPLDFMTVGLDIGFSVGELKSGENRISFSTVPWSLNVKFFFWKNAPFGFFLSPRIGGTALRVNGYGQNIVANGITSLYSHGGFYLSLELGWRIQLFPKTGANWPVQVGIDISLFDFGYYVAPWASPIFDVPQFSGFLGYKVFSNIRALILPRIGITLRF
ncbi:hypothetical protein B2904_orf1618 [Brachyspira pilosicoli B2904]|uniref:Serpentine_recp domain containing protein n=1 Tax=Brachyspira pilosicoli B2904 TaxID=1133568 RepID=J9UVJ1_BRAPL|nr:hypothetical protein [Brachyspira pilosicoli]AFR70953.1 hypothetical protein B2904_orf1618 [Brachyspira pilosicoli B2904]